MQPGTDQWGQPTQQAPPQPQYGQPPQQMIMGQPQAAQPQVGMGIPGMGVPATSATTALILSILGLVGCGICTAIPGLIIANQALTITNQYPGHPDGGSAKAAMVISWIVIGLTLVVILFYVVIGVVFVGTSEF
ncbi:MAG: hypothetical protein CXT67_04565 [Methanobacteriota archaeon]|nr:MAG: hypothetical protein CXT67_04565 [Euryarchaeota archaeon]